MTTTTMMKGHIVLVFSMILIHVSDARKLPTDSVPDYWARRTRLLASEQRRMIGGNIRFEQQERVANKILMEAKTKEIDNAFQAPEKFLPARSFLEANKEIENSEVFKIIRDLPKGAVLHSHDTSIVSADYVYNNITFRENLYYCEDNGTLNLHFFDQPNADCDWELLSELREDPGRADEVNSKILEKLTMNVDDPDTAYPDVNSAWDKFISIFAFITPMLTYRPVYEDHFYRGLQELYDDNVLYLELRSTLPTLYELNGTTYSSLETARIYMDTVKRFVDDHPDFVGAKLIYAPVRSVSDETMDDYISTALKLKEQYPSFMAGFDLVGQEDTGRPLVDFVDKLREIEPKMNFFFHAGETDWNGLSTDENLIDAVLLNTKRIGHGYALLKHPAVLKEVKSRNIAVELNPISNQVLSLVKDLRNHPGSAFFAMGVPVVVSNDDPGLWGSKGLSFDFYEAFVGMMSRQADLRSLKKLAINSIVYSSLDEEEKKKAFEIWRKKWDEFVNNLVATKRSTVVLN